MKLHNLFTRLGVGEIARRHPMVYADIGLRGGFQDDLHPMAFAVDAVGFEPDPEAYKLLEASPDEAWKSVRMFPWAVGEQTGRQALYIPQDPQSASLLKHDPKVGERFQKQQFFELDRATEVDAKSLTESLTAAGIETIDYLKIDIEGAELGIFQSAPEIMANVLAVKTEVSFLPARLDQPLAHHVAGYMDEMGFELMDLIKPAHWRRAGYLIHPYMSGETPPYSRGQIIHGDYLYFRDPERLGDDLGSMTKLALIAMSFGYFDHALAIFERPPMRDYIWENFKMTPPAIVAQASRRYGRKMFAQAAYRQLRELVPFIRYAKNLG